MITKALLITNGRWGLWPEQVDDYEPPVWVNKGKESSMTLQRSPVSSVALLMRGIDYVTHKTILPDTPVVNTEILEPGIKMSIDVTIPAENVDSVVLSTLVPAIKSFISQRYGAHSIIGNNPLMVANGRSGLWPEQLDLYEPPIWINVGYESKAPNVRNVDSQRSLWLRSSKDNLYEDLGSKLVRQPEPVTITVETFEHAIVVTIGAKSRFYPVSRPSMQPMTLPI